MVMSVLDEGYLGMGRFVESFEKKLSQFFNRDTSCVVNGTAAIQLALQAAGIERNDEVLVPSLTYVASYQAISATGAIPVSCDITKDNLCLDPKQIESRITKKTKAILAVHYAGEAGNIDEILTIAKKYHLRVIEDAAHAFGSSHKGRLVGSFGDIACFSFDGIKNITSGEGGCIVSGDKKIIEKVNELRLLGVLGDSKQRFLGKRSWDFEVNEQGWRYHMSNIMAAIGIEQFNKKEILFKKRQNLAKSYDKLLINSKVDILKKNYNLIVPHIYPIILPKASNRNILRQNLLDCGIETGVHYKPNHLLNLYKKINHNLPITKNLQDRILTLPLHPGLTNKDIEKVVSCLETNL